METAGGRWNSVYCTHDIRAIPEFREGCASRVDLTSFFHKLTKLHAGSSNCAGQ